MHTLDRLPFQVRQIGRASLGILSKAGSFCLRRSFLFAKGWIVIKCGSPLVDVAGLEQQGFYGSQTVDRVLL